MGGFNSGRWSGHTKARTVEASRALSVSALSRDGLLVAGRAGRVAWSVSGREVASVGFTVRSAGDDQLTLVLAYRVGGEDLAVPVPLEPIPQHLGGRRWWFRCPLSVRGVTCGRRAGKLYLPPSGRYFGCRSCHRLTYTACQTHDKRVDQLRRDPALLRAIIDAPQPDWRQLILALKAIPS